MNKVWMWLPSKLGQCQAYLFQSLWSAYSAHNFTTLSSISYLGLEIYVLDGFTLIQTALYEEELKETADVMQNLSHNMVQPSYFLTRVRIINSSYYIKYTVYCINKAQPTLGNAHQEIARIQKKYNKTTVKSTWGLVCIFLYSYCQ